MNRKKLDRLWADLGSARRSPQSAGDLADLATRAGRKLKAGGKHPMWVSFFPQHRAFPIPVHGGNTNVSPYVRKVVLDHLEADAAAWEEIVLGEDGDNDGGNGGYNGRV